MGAGGSLEVGSATTIQHQCQQVVDIFQQDVQYVSRILNGEISQSGRAEATERNSRVILIAVRALMACALVRVACDAIKILARMSRMHAFSFLDRTITVLFLGVVFHDIFKYACNLSNHAELQHGLRVQFFLTGSEIDRNGRALNPYLEGTIVPSVWNSLFYHLRASAL